MMIITIALDDCNENVHGSHNDHDHGNNDDGDISFVAG